MKQTLTTFAGLFSANGAYHFSLGQRPRDCAEPMSSAESAIQDTDVLVGFHIAPTTAMNRAFSAGGGVARIPGALPQAAYERRAFGAKRT
jgi:hypothetical protein